MSAPKQSLGTSPTPSQPTASPPDSSVPGQTAALSPAMPRQYAEDYFHIEQHVLYGNPSSPIILMQAEYPGYIQPPNGRSTAWYQYGGVSPPV